MITRALNPARVNSVVLNEEERTAEVYLDPDQVSLAIGKGGLNVKLASMLVGYTIDVFRELDSEEDNDDVSLDEFTDAIEPWIIDELKKIGFQTAKGVLGAQREMIIQNADLEEETVDEVLRILQAEFE
jgi:N utilization substance protein A